MSVKQSDKILTDKIQLDLLAPMQWGWRYLLSFSLFGILLALTVLAIATPKYTASVVLVPSANRIGVPESKLGSLAGLANIAGGKLGGADKTTNIDRFRFLLTSIRLAKYQMQTRSILQVLYPERWDAKQKAWRPPSGPLQFIVGNIKKTFSFPAWQKPDEFLVVRTYKSNLTQSDVGETSLLKLSYTDANPRRAIWVLKSIVADVDNIVRSDALMRAQEQASYLRNRLKSESLLEYRGTLLTLLSEQEQTLMLANSNLPFTQDVMEDYSVSNIPTSTSPLAAGFIGCCFGVMVGYVFSFAALTIKRSRTHSTSSEVS